MNILFHHISSFNKASLMSIMYIPVHIRNISNNFTFITIPISGLSLHHSL
ncbi:Fe(3+)-Zn (2+) purple acid phosphatase [Gossypium arboreum]|uniref:Fe(3+)-Zn (2+) purple acid phosphatase n=1 Tax=Gossypium arboreum TaxID=29729 RepID=A0A0B0P0Z5_GOSAR|nr:Fe(3+)-Zn (2+) purple acid phosphatase [Gossypium arboreum]